jgi:hypothetical protein
MPEEHEGREQIKNEDKVPLSKTSWVPKKEVQKPILTAKSQQE